MSLAALAAAVAALPHPGDLKTFGDWIVGCDNGRACEARALIPDGSDGNWSVLALRRSPAANAPALVDVTPDEPDKAVVIVAAGAKARLHFEAGGAMTAPADFAPKLAQAARTVDALQVLDAHGKTSSQVSLKGAAAALLWIDDRQGRVGTVTALIKPGPKPASVVPAAPTLPTIAISVSPSAKPPAKLTAKALKDARGDSACQPDSGQEEQPPQYDRLDAAHTLAVVPNICASGAYNIDNDILVIADGHAGAPALADFEKVFGDDHEGAGDVFMNAGWDAKTRRLNVGFKGRGIGDCGTWRDYAWDGRRFRFVAEQDMGECRGAGDPIPTWRANVVVR